MIIDADSQTKTMVALDGENKTSGGDITLCPFCGGDIIKEKERINQDMMNGKEYALKKALERIKNKLP